MSFPRERIPEEVWRAREAEDAYRAQAERDYDAHLAAVIPIRSGPPQVSWLDAVTVLGRTDRCPDCGLYVPVCDVRDGVHVRECCGMAWDAEGDDAPCV